MRLKMWLEFHDSTLTALRETNVGVALDLDAYVHRWEASGGSWRGTGWRQPVRILISGAGHGRVSAALPLTVADGGLRVGAITYHNLVPLTFSALEPVSLRLQLANAAIIEVAGVGVSLEPCREAHFVEDLPDDLRPGDVFRTPPS